MVPLSMVLSTRILIRSSNCFISPTPSKLIREIPAATIPINTAAPHCHFSNFQFMLRVWLALISSIHVYSVSV